MVLLLLLLSAEFLHRFSQLHISTSEHTHAVPEAVHPHGFGLPSDIWGISMSLIAGVLVGCVAAAAAAAAAAASPMLWQ